MTTGTPVNGGATDLLERSDAELLAASRTGDSEAYGELFRRHSPAATALGRRLTGHPSDADDLVSEAFTKVLAALQNGNGPTSAMRPYLLTAVRRVHVDRAVAAQKVQPTDDMSAHDPGVPFIDPALAGLERSMVAQAYQQLPERWQMVLWHTEVEEMSPKDIAPLLGMSPNAVAALALRARAGLREAYLAAHVTQTTSPECERMLPKLAAYVRGSAATRERTAVERHLPDCENCRAVLAELEDVGGRMRAVVAPLILGLAAAGYLADLAATPAIAAPVAAAVVKGGAGSAAAVGSGGSGGAGGGGGGAAGSSGSSSGGLVGAGAAAVSGNLGGWLIGGAAAVIVVGAVAGAMQLANNADKPTSGKPSSSSSAPGVPGAAGPAGPAATGAPPAGAAPGGSNTALPDATNLGNRTNTIAPSGQVQPTSGSTPTSAPSTPAPVTAPSPAPTAPSAPTTQAPQPNPQPTAPTTAPPVVPSTTPPVVPTTPPAPTNPPVTTPPVTNPPVTTPPVETTNPPVETPTTPPETTPPVETPTTPVETPPVLDAPQPDFSSVTVSADSDGTVRTSMPALPAGGTVTVTVGDGVSITGAELGALPCETGTDEAGNATATCQVPAGTDDLPLTLTVKAPIDSPGAISGTADLTVLVTSNAANVRPSRANTRISIDQPTQSNGSLTKRVEFTGPLDTLAAGGALGTDPTSAELNTPAEAIRYARVYWYGGGTGSDLTLTAGGISRTLNAEGVARANQNDGGFTATADVTDLLQQAQTEGPIQLLASAPGQERQEAGWTILVVRDLPDAPQSTVRLYDGQVSLTNAGSNADTHYFTQARGADQAQVLAFGVGKNSKGVVRLGTEETGWPFNGSTLSGQQIGIDFVPLTGNLNRITVKTQNSTFVVPAMLTKTLN